MSVVARVGRIVGRHPRWWGLLFAIALAVSYVLVIRPGREAFARYVAMPVLESVDTERARQYDVVRAPRYRGGIYAVPRGEMTDAAREAGSAQWAPPVGALFIFPAMFLVWAFPERPYWLWLLGYHVALGVFALAVFAAGLAWIEPAFALYQFSQTYLAETVSLVVPLLLWLAGRAEPQASAERASTTEASAASGGDSISKSNK